MMRMTGCPNGCARPYMAELAWIGDGKDSYQVYVGGSPVLTNVGFSYQERAKIKTMENTIEPLFAMWKEQRRSEAICWQAEIAGQSEDQIPKISTTDQLPARLTDTCATRGSRARAAASIAAHSVTFSAKGTISSGLASV